jgi:hypothetical protein
MGWAGMGWVGWVGVELNRAKFRDGTFLTCVVEPREARRKKEERRA